MKKDKVTFEYFEEAGVSYCYIKQYGKTFVGSASCHPDDKDMQSERTGCEIANRRAYIALLEHERDNIIIPGLRSLKQLYYSINTSKEFNKKSYEAKALHRHIRIFENDLATIKAELADEKQSLKEYIEGKDKFYKRIRTINEKAKAE